MAKKITLDISDELAQRIDAYLARQKSQGIDTTKKYLLNDLLDTGLQFREKDYTKLINSYALDNQASIVQSIDQLLVGQKEIIMSITNLINNISDNTADIDNLLY